MKILELDWHAVFDLLPQWLALPIDRRHFLLHLSQSGSYGTRNPEGTDDLVDRGWLEPARAGKSRKRMRFVVSRERRFWLRTCRSLSRTLPVADDDGGIDVGWLADYLHRHYTAQEIARLCREPPDGDRFELACQIHEGDWLRRFLQWNGGTGADHADASHHRWREASPAAIKAARRLIELVVEHGGPMAISDVLAAADRISRRDDLAAGLALGFREALLLIAVDHVMAPFVSIWPPAIEMLRRERPMAPDSVAFADAELLCRPLLIDDMTTLLLESIAEPPRVKADGGLFARSLRSIGAALPALPGWLSTDFTPLQREQRVARAAHFAFVLRLAEAQGVVGKDLTSTVTDRGRQWLLLDAKERLKCVLDRLREALRLAQDEYRARDPWENDTGEAYLHFVPLAYEFSSVRYLADVDSAVADAYRTVRRDAIIDLQEFFLLHSEERNPLSEHDQIRHYEGPDGDERIWEMALKTFFYERLLQVGGVALGPLAGGGAGFSLTDIGRYLLGEADDFDLDAPAATGDIIVQPNFEIVFLSPSPIDQMRARTFAAPTAALEGPESVGTLFVIDRASVQRAVMTGQDAEQVLAAAGDLSKQPLPANVARQLRDWAAEVRWVDVRTAVVVDCGDAETAVRVLAAVGKRGRRLSESAVELADGSDLTPAVRRKLISRGVFVRS